MYLSSHRRFIARAKNLTFQHLLNNLLVLLKNLLENLLNDLALVADVQSSLLVADLGQAELVALVEKVLDGALAVRKPLVELAAALFDDSLVGGAALGDIGLFESTRVFAEVLTDGLHLVLAEEALGAGTPDELLELLDGLFAEELAGEGVEVVAVFHLRRVVSLCRVVFMGCLFSTYSVLPDTSGSCEETSRRIPLDVSHTVVVCGGQKLEVGSEVLVLLVLVALKVKVVEVEVV
jgi:hypothetical protein